MQVIQVPYDSGRKNFRMGNGHLVKHALADLGEISVETIEVEELTFEQGTTFRILRSLSDAVSRAVARGQFPLVLAGGCISSAGTLAGLGQQTGIVWLDAHGDFNTPDTTPSGFFDGMALATATGRCWRNLARTVPGFVAVSDENVALVGARALDQDEEMALQASGISTIAVATVREQGVRAALDKVLTRLPAKQLYLHIDLDVLDLGEARVNPFSCEGGLTVAELLEIVQMVASRKPLAAAAITAYDPSSDEDGRGLQAAALLVKELNGVQAARLAGTA